VTPENSERCQRFGATLDGRLRCGSIVKALSAFRAESPWRLNTALFAGWPEDQDFTPGSTVASAAGAFRLPTLSFGEDRLACGVNRDVHRDCTATCSHAAPTLSGLLFEPLVESRMSEEIE
jgi:hypothetical protein